MKNDRISKDVVEEVVVLVVKELHQKDSWYENDYGQEFHSLEGVPVVCFVEVPFSKAAAKMDEIGEANADNPPYDSYSVVMAYYKLTKEVISLDWIRDSQVEADELKGDMEARQEMFEAQVADKAEGGFDV